MAQQLQISESIASRTVETEVVKNVGISERLPAADRVVSVNARVEITNVDVGTNNVVYSGIIRTTIFYASADDPSNVVSIRRNFNFTDRVSVPGARPGYEVTIEPGISDIDFYVINDRLLGVEYTVISDIDITAPERVSFVEEEEGIELRTRSISIRRELRERNYTRNLTSIERLDSGDPDIERIVDVNSEVFLIDIVAARDEVNVTGIIRNDILYLSDQGKVEYVSLQFPFSESFTFRGVTPDMTPFIEAVVTEESADRVDSRRIRKRVTVNFKILVVRKEEVRIPTGIVTPQDLFPVTKTVLVERIVAEEKTRILIRDRVSIAEGNPDIDRIIRATGRIVGGTLTATASSGGVVLEGDIEVNILYVADLPNQPVYFASTITPFSHFADVPGVTPDMNVFPEVTVRSVTASKVSDREISVRVTLDVNLLITETVRVSIVVGVSERPEEEAPAGFITYTVQSGDTLYLIAQRFNVSVNQLIQINNIADPRNIQVGQQILIPGS